MKILLALSTLAFAGFAHAAPVSLTCTCDDSMCEKDAKSVAVTYDNATQFFTLASSNWEFSGYAARQYSKTTATTYYTLPATTSFSSTRIEVLDVGGLKQFSVSGTNYDCVAN